MRSASHFDNLDRFSHVEDEYLPAFTHGTGLKDQLRRFGDAHEVAA